MSWERFKKTFYQNAALGVALDISRIPFPDDFLAGMDGRLREAFAAMAALEKGAIANPDENRMVGHYWLRAPELAPNPELAKEIKDTVGSIQTFAADVHSGKIKPPTALQFSHVLSIG